MKINFFSDLHLENSNMVFDNIDGDVVVLAGDISSDIYMLLSFIERNLLDKQVVYVLGNHEYECRVVNNVVDEYRAALGRFSNVHLLDNEAITLCGVRFIGSTLWSNFEGFGSMWKKEAMDICEKNINDFSSIFIDDGLKVRNIRGGDLEKLFDISCRFINYELKVRETLEPKIVVSHFAPSRKSVSSRFEKDLLSSYWVNDLDSLLGYSDYWIHGHTHESFDYSVGGTRVLCNPRGVSKTFNLSSNVFFDKQAGIDIVGLRKKNKLI